MQSSNIRIVWLKGTTDGQKLIRAQPTITILSKVVTVVPSEVFTKSIGSVLLNMLYFCHSLYVYSHMRYIPCSSAKTKSSGFRLSKKDGFSVGCLSLVRPPQPSDPLFFQPTFALNGACCDSYRHGGLVAKASTS